MLAACGLGLDSPDGGTAGAVDATGDGEATDGGATAAGLQAATAITMAAAPKAILGVLFTDRNLHADLVGRRLVVAASRDP